jgi:hypothetical protein
LQFGGGSSFEKNLEVTDTIQNSRERQSSHCVTAVPLTADHVIEEECDDSPSAAFDFLIEVTHDIIAVDNDRLLVARSHQLHSGGDTDAVDEMDFEDEQEETSQVGITIEIESGASNDSSSEGGNKE